MSYGNWEQVLLAQSYGNAVTTRLGLASNAPAIVNLLPFINVCRGFIIMGTSHVIKPSSYKIHNSTFALGVMELRVIYGV